MTTADEDFSITLFDEDADDMPPSAMSGPSEATSQRIGQHLRERQAQGAEPYWPDWDE